MSLEDPLCGHNRYTTLALISRTEDTFLVTAEDTQRERSVVAVKLLHGAGGDMANIRSIITEHPHVVRLLDIFTFKGMLGIAMEFADHGNMKTFMASRGDRCLDETTSRFYFQQLIFAVEYAHRRGFSVGDVKLENLLLKSSSESGAVYPVLKLSNRLGIAVNVDPAQQNR